MYKPQITVKLQLVPNRDFGRRTIDLDNKH